MLVENRVCRFSKGRPYARTLQELLDRAGENSRKSTVVLLGELTKLFPHPLVDLGRELHLLGHAVDYS